MQNELLPKQQSLEILILFKYFGDLVRRWFRFMKKSALIEEIKE